MRSLILLALVGLAAQLVDGALGMAYGVTSTTLLLAIGTNPAAASATIHLSEIGTTLVSGLSHWRFGNVDWKVVLRIGVPGAVGAFLGAYVLSNLATDMAKPVMSAILLALGIYILIRFTLFGLRKDRLGLPLRKRFLAPLGLFAGFVDATGGGGWGPVGTPALLASGRIEPRKVIGSIDTSEFLVADRRQPRLPDRARLAGHQPGLGPRAPRRRRHRRTDRRVARPQDPRPHPGLGGRWPHRPHQRPHPAPQRVGRPGRHPRRGPHPRRDRARLGRRIAWSVRAYRNELALEAATVTADDDADAAVGAARTAG